MIVDTVFPVSGIKRAVRKNIAGCGLECLLPVIGTGTPTPAHHHCRKFLQASRTAQHGRKAVSLRIPCFCIVQIQQQFYMKTVPLRKDMRTEYRSSARPCFRRQQYPNQASYYIFHPLHLLIFNFQLSIFNLPQSSSFRPVRRIHLCHHNRSPYGYQQVEFLFRVLIQTDRQLAKE